MIPMVRDQQLVSDWLAIEPAFDLVDANEYWALYERDRAVELPDTGVDPLVLPD